MPWLGFELVWMRVDQGSGRLGCGFVVGAG